MMENTLSTITDFTITSDGKTQVDDISNHLLTGEINYPYISKVVIDENYEEKPNVVG